VRKAFRTILAAFRTVRDVSTVPENALRTVRDAPRTVCNAFRTVRDASTTPANPSRTVRLGLRGKIGGRGIVRGGTETIDILPRQERIGCMLLRQEVTMTQKEYEERRRALEQELQADLALIHAAYEARIRSLDSLRQLAAEGNEPGAVSGPFTGAQNRPATPRDAVPPTSLPPLPAVGSAVVP
jgi:hypothetical protein